MGALHAGQMLEGTSYQIVREIGSGGMGVVYEIEHVRLKKRYVAKVIHEQIRNDDGALKRMEREAQVLAGIMHPNVVQVHDFGTTSDGVTYFVMERLDGVDLRRYIKRYAVTRLRAIAIVIDVLDALEHVHRQGIVHRDIKPENIFLAEQPNQANHTTITKVLDFGIVSIVDGDGRISQGRITKTGGFVGTLYYAAPEQMQGKPPGPANDVYAAGLVLFELIAGRGPFDDDPGVGLSRCFKNAPALTELSRAPRELSDVVAHALAQDPTMRPSAGAFANALRSVSVHPNVVQGGDEQDSVRAEVDDLLAQFAPMQNAAIRPAAGREITPAPAIGAVGATAAPQTPVMPGAPGRGPAPMAEQASISLDPTMASPFPVTRPPDVSSSSSTQASAQQREQANPLAASGMSPNASSVMAAPGMHFSQPPPQPTAHGLGQPHVAHAYSSPPQSPRFASDPTPTPQLPQRRAETSPGVYATVDELPISSRAVPRSSGGAGMVVGVLGGAVVLIGLLVAGAMFLFNNNNNNKHASSANDAKLAASSASAPAFETASASAAASAARIPDPAPTTSVVVATPASAPKVVTTTMAKAGVAATTPVIATTRPTSATSTPSAQPTPPVKNPEKEGYVKAM